MAQEPAFSRWAGQALARIPLDHPDPFGLRRRVAHAANVDGLLAEDRATLVAAAGKSHPPPPPDPDSLKVTAPPPPRR